MHGIKPPPITLAVSGTPDADLARHLTETIAGDVRFDPLWRTLYATDAGIHEIMPAGVVLPRDAQDVVRAVRACAAHGTPVVPRGAGTGLTGGAVGGGVQLDVSRYMTRIGPIDPDQRTVVVEPGVVLDELNAAAAPFGLHFAPDVATASRATLGGMIANNSCGAHSIRYGRTVDHVRALTVVTGDGATLAFHRDDPAHSAEPTRTHAEPTRARDESTRGRAAPTRGRDEPTRGRAEEIRDALARIRDGAYDEIQRRFPRILRGNAGYGLDRLGPPGTPVDPTRILCGSEGTLGIVVSATLKLTPLPARRGLVILHFESVFDALAATPDVLEHRPAAVELIDRLILHAARRSPGMSTRCRVIAGDPGAVLVVEFFAEDDASLRDPMRRLIRAFDGTPSATRAVSVLDPVAQADVWAVRAGGLGLLMSRPGDRQPYAFVEDSAVDPARLSAYIRRFAEVLEREGVEQAGYYAHASVGCIHVRPVLNLKSARDVQRMSRIADAVSSLALEFGGTMTGEHGDGLVRSCWLEKMLGPKIIDAFRRTKAVFDPTGVLNPGKIVDPPPMTEHLRLGPSFEARAVKSAFDYGEHGGPAGLAGMCTGIGVCRQTRAGTMCPTYMATRDESQTTRARANALRVALSNRGPLDGLTDPHLFETLEPCIACKACKTECPTGVDMARLKAEALHARHLRHGVTRAARRIADAPDLLRLASRAAWITNGVMRSRPARWFMEKRYGLDRRIPPPTLARRTFRQWFARHQRRQRQRRGSYESSPRPRGSNPSSPRPRGSNPSSPRGRVVYFVDTWTNYLTPGVGIAAVHLLEAAGYDVVCPPHGCCGRPHISQGLLGEARDRAEQVLRILVPFAREGTPIVGTEPSCVLTLVDELPDLVRIGGARYLAETTSTLDTFLARLLDADPDALTFRAAGRAVRFHGHCHHKALVGTADAMRLIQAVAGPDAHEIDGGCCGMAGAFGHHKVNYDLSRRIGDLRLFPAVRDRGDAEIVVSGFSCAQQIAHHTDAHPIHLAEYLAGALVNPRPELPG